jgi:hypothetical protein
MGTRPEGLIRKLEEEEEIMNLLVANLRHKFQDLSLKLEALFYIYFFLKESNVGSFTSVTATLRNLRLTDNVSSHSEP